MLNGGLVASSVALLMIGNSYTARNQLSDRVAGRVESGAMVDQASVASVTMGGARWADHAAQLDNPESALRRASQERAWGTWVLQEQSQLLGFPEGQSEREASLVAALTLAEEASRNGAQPHLFLTWGRRLGDARNPTRYPDYLTMQDLLTDGYLRTADALTESGYNVGIAPVGEAFRQVYLDDVADGEAPEGPNANFSRLYSKDGSHPSMYGTLLASAVMEASLFGRLHELPNADAVAEDEDFVEYLDEVARRLVLSHPFDAYAYPWATRWDGHDPVEVLGRSQRPAVAFETEATLAKVEVGGSLDGLVADGEVWIQEGANVATERVVFGVGGDNALIVNGGSLTVDRLEAGDGRVALRAGRFSVADFEGGSGGLSFQWEEGTFEVLGDAVLDIRLEQPEAGVLLLAQGSRLVLEQGDFRGTLRLDEPAEDQVDVLLADVLDVEDATVLAPEGYGWEIVSLAGNQALRLTRVGHGTTSEPIVSEGCGCAVRPEHTPVVWALAFVLCWARRERR